MLTVATKDLEIGRKRVMTTGYRVQAQFITIDNSKILWINSYLPFDPQHDLDDSELLECLAEVKRLVKSIPDCDTIWSGDLNWSIERDNQFTRAVNGTAERLGLSALWKEHTIDYTHIHTDKKSVSTIDHFFSAQDFLL